MRDLSQFSGSGYNKGRGVLWQVAWLAISGPLFKPWFVPSAFRVFLLRMFGASVGKNVLIRHSVKIHWPWKLSIGDYSWIGESAWILNLEQVTIGRSVCISQEALICTGSHDPESPSFEFDNGPISIRDGAWIAARAVVLRNVEIGEGVVVRAGQIVSRTII